jgi:hypothetical protein
MHDNELQMGLSSHDPENDLHIRFDSLLTRQEPDAPYPGSQIPMEPETSSIADDRTFMLVLDARSPLDELYPILVSHLDTLRQRGQLTHWNGVEVVQGLVTVVVTGDSMASSACANNPYSDIFWSSRGDVSGKELADDRLTPICI